MAKGKKKLRFVALIRVSTEKQERQGESLRTQKSQIESVVQGLGGTVEKWFGGQEHATSGWEHLEVDRLLKYCSGKSNPIDAVIVAHQDRWSRDNVASEQGLNHLQACGIRFFVLGAEHDLNDPTARLYLAMSSSISAYHAATQKMKSIENRIARARRGLPTAGKLPFGRTFDRGTETWSIIPEKKEFIEEVARRYLSGEPLKHIAIEHGVNHSSLHKTLMQRTGSEWSIRFKPDGVVVQKKTLVIPVKIPELLSSETIDALHRRSKANKTYSHGAIKNEYLLRRVVFCERCGYAMFGQTNHSGRRYYRHCRDQRVRECDSPLQSVPADMLEETVLLHLFAAFGNSQRLVDAMDMAIPDKEKVENDQNQLERANMELEKIERGRVRVLSQLEQDTITEKEATERLKKSKARRDVLLKKKEQFEETLRQIPDKDVIRNRAQEVASSMVGRDGLESMTYKEKRLLVETVFGGTTADGQRMGVYVGLIPGQEKRRRKEFTYAILGHLIREEYIMPLETDEKEFLENHYDSGAPPLQKKLTKSALY